MVSVSITSSLLLAFLTVLLSAKSSANSFSVDLIHRDSPKSPFYDPSATKWDWVNDAFRRSISRVGHFHKLSSKSSSDIKSRLLPADGEFIMKLSIGTPPLSQFGIVDMGSDLTWFQCKPCEFCFRQKSPIFNPKDSSTYRDVSCEMVRSYRCDNNTRNCGFVMAYSDASFAIGNVATETFTFESTSGQAVSIPKLIFGCGHKKFGTFENRSDGLIGLGVGKESFINQASNFTSGKFSYCLPPFDSHSNSTGKINFGNDATLAGPGVVTTPLKKSGSYDIMLESISVNNKKILNMEEQQYKENKDMVVDSGSLLTLLTDHLYGALNSEVQKAIPEKAILDPSEFYPLCYNSKDKIKYPNITFTFEGGAEVELQGTNIFIQPHEDRVCPSIIPSAISLLGNVAQANHLVGFDLVKNVVSFKPSDCTK